MTRLLVGLEHDGLVRRERDAHDGRVTWVHPTPKGARILKEGRRRRVAALARELDTLDGAKLASLARAAELIEQIVTRGYR